NGIFAAGTVSWHVSEGNTVTLSDTIGGGDDGEIEGAFHKTGPGTLVLSGSDPHGHAANSFTVEQGTLRNEGTVASQVSVLDGAVLGGSGTFTAPVAT